MNKDVYNYFERLEDKGFKRQNGFLIADERCKCITQHPMSIFNINGILYYAKSNVNNEQVQAAAASQMYNDLGILTPPLTLMKIKDNKHPRGTLYALSQDVTSIPVYQATLAADVLRKTFSKRSRFNTKWDILTSSRIRDAFLSIMTPDCLNQLIDIFLLDELRTDVDRHMENYFLVKLPHEDKYSSIIPIDMEKSELMFHPPKNKGEFHQFLHRYYNSYTPTEQLDDENYIERIETLRDMLSYDVLSARQIQLLRKAINYNFPNAIKNICTTNNLPSNMSDTYVPYEMLWEYLQNTLATDLDM